MQPNPLTHTPTEVGPEATRERPRVLVVARSDQVEEAFRAAVERTVRLDVCRSTGTSFDLELLKGADRPEILVVDFDPEAPEEVAALKRIAAASKGKGLPVIAVAPLIGPALMRRLLRDGMADVLTQPFQAEEIRDALANATPPASGQGGSAAGGRILTFARASGGAGATTLAVNAACLLAEPRRDGRPRVCLLDLDLQFGAAALQLDLEARMVAYDMAQAPERLDAQLFLSSLVEHPSGVRVLTAPSTPIPLETFQPDFVAQLLALAQAEFDYVVVDLPIALTSWTDTVLSRSELIFLITQLSVPAVRQVHRLLQVLQEEGLYNLPVRLVLNRHQNGFMFGSGLRRRQVEKALQRGIDFTIPDDSEVVLDAQNQGKPVLKVKRRSRFVKAVRGMLEDALHALPARMSAAA